MGGCTESVTKLRRSLLRVKRHTSPDESASELDKCLTTFDLTNLAIGSILGAGIYVVSGHVSLNVAGPAVVLSFTIAGLASLMSGLCYAEFGSRVPNTTGSAYAYSYHTVGELIAFVIGWNLILEYMIGTAADARALSASIDYMTGYWVSNHSKQAFGIIPHVNTYPDFLSGTVSLIVTAVLALGVKESANWTTVFNFLNGGVALLVIVLGSLKADATIWAGHGGFAPAGFHGILSGAASCFYAFVGFDILATTGEEARSAEKSIPTAVTVSLLICWSLYVGVSAVLTMLLPFRSTHSQTPLIESLDAHGFHWARWVVGSGAICGLCAALLGSQFPLPRIIYSMSCDGLIFRSFREVSARTDTPLLATIVPGIITAVFAIMLDLTELVEMMSIGTLLAYSLVCTCVLLLRYAPHPSIANLEQAANSDDSEVELQQEVQHLQLRTMCSTDDEDDDENSSSDSVFEANNNAALNNGKHSTIGNNSSANSNGASSNWWNLYAFKRRPRRLATSSTYRIVIGLTIAMWLLSIMASCLIAAAEHYSHLSSLLYIAGALLMLGWLVCVCVIYYQPQESVRARSLHFKVPFVPALPAVTIAVNVFLMVRLSQVTWIRFGVWLVIGFAIYFGYGIHFSELNTDRQQHQQQQRHLLPLNSSNSDESITDPLLNHPTNIDRAGSNNR